MHIVLLNQYYPPDEAPTGLMLESVAESLIDLGHEVTILCAKGGYAGASPCASPGKAHREGKTPRVIRIGATGFGRASFAGKLADYLTYCLGLVLVLAFMRHKPDRIVALTTPPYLSILARLVSALRTADHPQRIMDLYPDVMVAHGMLRKPSAAAAILERLARFGFGGARCAMVLTIGPDMAARTKAYLSDGIPCEWVPLWGTAEHGEISCKPEQETRGEGARPLVLMYSGNMGLGHRFTEFLEAATTAGPDFRWRFNGNGRRRKEIEEFAAAQPSAPIELGTYVPRAALAAHLASADVHLASLDPSWDGTMVPSKLQGIFAIGRPVLFVGSATCSMGHWILQSGGGWVVEPGNMSAMRNALDDVRDPQIREAKADAARAFALVTFNRRANAARIAALLSVH
jgi:glycosyltransferase involved in cell wall biosynthesis